MYTNLAASQVCPRMPCNSFSIVDLREFQRSISANMFMPLQFSAYLYFAEQNILLTADVTDCDDIQGEVDCIGMES